jgi:hypothetical protein
VSQALVYQINWKYKIVEEENMSRFIGRHIINYLMNLGKSVHFLRLYGKIDNVEKILLNVYSGCQENEVM